MVKGQFNTDANALNNRIKAHDEFGKNDLNSWIFENINLQSGDNVLDIGCGTGKQSIPLAKAVGETGSVTSVDLSKEALEILSEQAKSEGVDQVITTISTSHDNLTAHLKENSFDKIISSFSLYYSEDVEKVIQTIWNALKPGGILFFCGPSYENNFELKKFHYDLKNTPVPEKVGGAKFMEGIGQEVTKDVFNDVEICLFENPLSFSSSDAIYSYWKSYNLYDREIDTEFKEGMDQYFNDKDIFITKKRVIGVKATK